MVEDGGGDVEEAVFELGVFLFECVGFEGFGFAERGGGCFKGGGEPDVADGGTEASRFDVDGDGCGEAVGDEVYGGGASGVPGSFVVGVQMVDDGDDGGVVDDLDVTEDAVDLELAGNSGDVEGGVVDFLPLEFAIGDFEVFVASFCFLRINGVGVGVLCEGCGSEQDEQGEGCDDLFHGVVFFVCCYFI